MIPESRPRGGRGKTLGRPGRVCGRERPSSLPPSLGTGYVHHGGGNTAFAYEGLVRDLTVLGILFLKGLPKMPMRGLLIDFCVEST